MSTSTFVELKKLQKFYVCVHVWVEGGCMNVCVCVNVCPWAVFSNSYMKGVWDMYAFAVWYFSSIFVGVCQSLGAYKGHPITETFCVGATCSYMFQLWNITKIKLFVSFTDLEKVVHGFISSCLEYCNSLYTTLPKVTPLLPTHKKCCSLALN